MASSRLKLQVPSTADVWRRIGLTFYFPASLFSESGFREALGDNAQASRWLIYDGGTEVHLHATLERIEPLETDKEPPAVAVEAPPAPEYAAYLRITMYPGGLDVDEDAKPDCVDNETFFNALRSAFPEEQETFAPVCSVDLYYPTPPAEWRVPLLAYPPAFDEMSREFGTISLAGMTLRFQDSPQALFEVSVESSPEGDLLYVGPRFGMFQAWDKLEDIFRDGLKQAKEIADAFVIPGSTAAEEEEG